METTANRLPRPGGRMLGWDLWRFLGCFLIFMGHNFGQGFADLLDASMVPSTLGQSFYYPDITHAFIFSAVPLFIMISGFFALGRPVRDNDWTTAKQGFMKYILHYWKWLALALVIFLVFPGVWPDRTPFAGRSVGQSVEMVLKNFVNTNLLQGGLTGPVALNWFIVGLALLTLLAPLFRPFIQSKDMKMVRTVTFIILTYACVFPGIRMIGNYFLTVNPTSLAADFFATLEPFQPQSFTWFGFWIACYLLGGWFAVDKQAQEFVKKISWPVTIVFCVVIAIAHVMLSYAANYVIPPDGWEGLTTYSKGGWIPITAAYLVLAWKLNFVIREDSRLGKFIQGWSPDTLGVMIFGWAFGPACLTGIMDPLMTSMIHTFWNPAAPWVLTLVWFLFNLAYYIAVMVIVHLLKNIPYVGGFFRFSLPKFMTSKSPAASKKG